MSTSAIQPAEDQREVDPAKRDPNSEDLKQIKKDENAADLARQMHSKCHIVEQDKLKDIDGVCRIFDSTRLEMGDLPQSVPADVPLESFQAKN